MISIFCKGPSRGVERPWLGVIYGVEKEGREEGGGRRVWCLHSVGVRVALLG